MWSDALARLALTERLRRDAFRPTAVGWEPPVDVLETTDGLLIVVALPGVRSETWKSWSAVMICWCAARGVGRTCSARRGLHRIELPHGHFERHLPLPPGRLPVGVAGLRGVVCFSHCGGSINGFAGDHLGDANAPAESLILVALTDTVLLPGLVLPLTIGSPAAGGRVAGGRAHRTAPRGGPAKGARSSRTPALAELQTIGTEARLLRYFTGRDGSHNAIVQGVGRVELQSVLRDGTHPAATVRRVAEPTDHTPEIDARVHQLRERALEVLGLIEQAPAEMATAVRSIEQPGALADFVTGLLDLTPIEKQEILETIPLLSRLDLVIARLAYRHEVLRLSHDIRAADPAAPWRDGSGNSCCGEQLKAIQKELGESDDVSPEIEELRRKLEAAGMPPEIETQAKRELRRLERMPEASGETGMVRTYLEWLTELPWRIADEAPIDIAEARAVLDEDHFDLEKIKRRILEFLAVRKLNPDGKGPILCFVGPPGVGKTSLGQSIARATGRKFIRVSLGGVHDEAEIRGHRRTYVGAMPGNIIQGNPRAVSGTAS